MYREDYVEGNSLNYRRTFTIDTLFSKFTAVTIKNTICTLLYEKMDRFVTREPLLFHSVREDCPRV